MLGSWRDSVDRGVVRGTGLAGDFLDAPERVKRLLFWVGLVIICLVVLFVWWLS